MQYNLVKINTITRENVLQIRNLRTNSEIIHREIFQQVLNSINADRQAAIPSIEKNVFKLKKKIEAIYGKHAATPADMGTPSFRIYLWLRFLAQRDHLLQHIHAVETFTSILFNSKKISKLNSKNLMLKIDYSGYLYQRKSAKGKIALQVNEAFISAPFSIKKAIISAAFAKRKGKAISLVREYTGVDVFIKTNKAISGLPISNNLTCVGKEYDLSTLYNSTNKKYFSAKLKQPRLVWSSTRAKRRLGYYHPEIHTIAINKKLDDKKMPRLLINYVLYHEMLHQHFGIEHRNGRRYAHTPAFHQAEKQFEQFKEAENLIKLLQ